MKEILLCKYGEIILKGANRRYFEDMLERQLKRKARAHGNFNVYRAQSTLYVEPLDEAADMDGMLADAAGCSALSRSPAPPYAKSPWRASAQP